MKQEMHVLGIDIAKRVLGDVLTPHSLNQFLIC